MWRESRSDGRFRHSAEFFGPRSTTSRCSLQSGILEWPGTQVESFLYLRVSLVRSFLSPFLSTSPSMKIAIIGE